jgi:hypothetical protein
MATMIEGEAGPSTIPLYLINGVATIWDAQSMSTSPSLTIRSSPPSPLASSIHKKREGRERRKHRFQSRVEADISCRYITLSA